MRQGRSVCAHAGRPVAVASSSQAVLVGVLVPVQIRGLVVEQRARLIQAVLPTSCRPTPAGPHRHGNDGAGVAGFTVTGRRDDSDGGCGAGGFDGDVRRGSGFRSGGAGGDSG